MILNHPGPFPLDRRQMALAVWHERRRIIETWRKHLPVHDSEWEDYDRARALYDEAGRELAATNPNLSRSEHQ